MQILNSSWFENLMDLVGLLLVHGGLSLNTNSNLEVTMISFLLELGEGPQISL